MKITPRAKVSKTETKTRGSPNQQFPSILMIRAPSRMLDSNKFRRLREAN